MLKGNAQGQLGKGTCALCLVGPLQMWGLVTAHMITRWLREHGESPRDSKAKQRSVHAYRQVAVCRMCMQQFSVNREADSGSIGPDHDQISEKRRASIKIEASRRRKQFNIQEEKKTFEVTLATQFRHHLWVKAAKEKEEQQKLEREREKKRMRNSVRDVFSPKRRAKVEKEKAKQSALLSTGTGDKSIAADSVVNSISSWSPSTGSSYSGSSSGSSYTSSDSEDEAHADDMLQSEKVMQLAIKRLRMRRRKHIAYAALHASARESSALRAAVQGVQARSGQPAWKYRGRWWGLQRMPARHMDASLKFKGRGKKVKALWSPSKQRIRVKSSGNNATPRAHPQRPSSAAPSRSLARSNAQRRGRKLRPSSAPMRRHRSSDSNANEDTAPSAKRGRQSHNPTRRKVREPSSVKPMFTPRTTTKSDKTKKQKFKLGTDSLVRIYGTGSNVAYSSWQAKNRHQVSLRSAQNRERNDKARRKRTVTHEDLQSRRKRSTVAGVKKRADYQVHQQHRVCRRKDVETKRERQGRLHDHGEHRGSPDQVKKWFRQAKCVPHPAAVIMGHLRAMPTNVDMFLGTCREITEDIRECQLYVDHGFVPLALDFLRCNQMELPSRLKSGGETAERQHTVQTMGEKEREDRGKQIRKALYPPLSVIAQHCGDVLVVEGAIELLVESLRKIVSEVEWEKCRLEEDKASVEREASRVDSSQEMGDEAVKDLRSDSPIPTTNYTLQNEITDIVRVLTLTLDVIPLKENTSGLFGEDLDMEEENGVSGDKKSIDPSAPSLIADIHRLLKKVEELELAASSKFLQKSIGRLLNVLEKY